MYIKYTYVDAKTGTPVTEAPAVNGPAYPDVPDLVFTFALESMYPTEQPIFFGTCRNGTPANFPGLLAVLTEPDYIRARDNEMKARLSKAKLEKFEELKQHRKRSELRGITVTSLGEANFPIPITIPCELDDQTRITAVLTNMGLFPDITPVKFKANNNAFVEATYDQIRLIAHRVSKLVQACFNNECEHTMAISALTTPEAVKQYNVSTGWPN